MSAVARPRVLCLLGTDHHPFARLVDWCDELAASRPDVDVLVQHGASAAPRVAAGVAYLGKDELARELNDAHVAITHGGPGLISDVRNAGLRPLVVARDPRLGEHVDAHQMRFTRRFAGTGSIVEIGLHSDFEDYVEKALAGDRGEGLDPDLEAARVQESVDRFAHLVDPLMLGRSEPRLRATRLLGVIASLRR